jgi:hypothetical protein
MGMDKSGQSSSKLRHGDSTAMEPGLAGDGGGNPVP